MKKGFVLAIDGPAGAGKSTIAKLAAGKLGFAYIDTGAMYRAVTWKLLQTGEPFSPELAGKLANEIRITFRPENAINRVFVDGTEVTDAIRTAEVTGLVSKVAAVPEVRTAMTDQQRRMGAEGGIVMDGRDIGTVVFPGPPPRSRTGSQRRESRLQKTAGRHRLPRQTGQRAGSIPPAPGGRRHLSGHVCHEHRTGDG